MFLDSRKRKNTNTTLEERTWLITHAEENKKLSSAKLALDFTSKFNRPINRSTVSRILSNKQQLKSMISVVNYEKYLVVIINRKPGVKIGAIYERAITRTKTLCNT